MQYLLHSISGLSDLFVNLLSTGGYWVLAITLILEAVPVFGSFIPGHIVVIAAGFLVNAGIFNIWTALGIAFAASVIGDVIGYLIGRRYGHGMIVPFGKFFFLKNEYVSATLEKTKKLIDTHPGKTIVFGKFSPITRSLAPFLTGASGVHIRTFWFYNILGGVLWVVASVMVGYLFGASYDVAAYYFGRLMLAGIITAILIVWAFRLANQRFHVFKKYEIFVLCLNLIALWGLVKTIQDSFSLHSFMSNFDIATNIFMTTHVTPVIARIAFTITSIGGTYAMLAIGLGLGFVFFIQKKFRRSAILLLSIVSTAGVVTFLKEFFMRVRPHNSLMTLADSSFPSGHAALSAAFFVVFVYITLPHISSLVKREAFIVLCVLIVACVGLSRLILNVHWASDVIAGWALGIFLATGSILIVKYLAAFFIKKQD